MGFNLLKKKILIIGIAVLLLISGTGIAAAYWKLAQNGAPPNNDRTIPDDPGYGLEGESDFGVGKYFVNPLPAGGIVSNGTLHTPKDSSINYQISFSGKLDKNPNVAKADVMILIDRSMSMKSPVPPDGKLDECIFGPDTTKNNSKLCWSIQAINGFIGLTGEQNREIRVGYVTYAAKRYTTNDVNPQNFKPLSDMWGLDNQRSQTKNWLKQVNFVDSDEADASGTAMGKATNFALDELQQNGRADVQKYIIILTDGVGNLNPLMTGCASWRRTASDAWPSGLRDNTYQTCRACPFGKRNDGVCKNSPETFIPPYIMPHYESDLVDCCINSTPDSTVLEGYPPDHEEIKITLFNNSPVGKAAARDIKMPMIGFGVADSEAEIGKGNLNDTLLRKIAAVTYKEPNAAQDWAFINKTPTEITNAFNEIFHGISGDRAVPIHFEETLPAGVDLSEIKIERNVKNLGSCPASNNYYCRQLYTTNAGGGNDNNNIHVDKNGTSGRMIIKFDLNESHYTDGDNAGRIPFVNKKFFVTLTVNTANATASAFDLDQNFDPDCDGVEHYASVSNINWNFNFPEPHQTKTNTPKLCVGLRNQYTGDVYGTGISNYLFPGIDVLVARDGIAPLGGTQAVWELENYNFSATSFSNFSNYQNYLGNQIESLKQKATLRGNAVLALQSPVNKNLRPEGEIFYIPISAGNQTIGSDISLGSGRRTVIIEGDLTIDASIVKNADKESTAAIIVLGNVVITGGQKSIQLGIIAPGFGPNWGWINIESSNNYLDVLGFLIGDHVRLKSQASADTQSILYDPDLIKFPPPGLAGLSLPLYQEIAP